MKHNIYEIPKVHPFIKTLEKVKELRDNLDEHISDLCRLNRFREAIIDEPDSKYEALCFEWQYDFVKKFLDDLAKVAVISFDEVDKELSEYYSRYLIK